MGKNLILYPDFGPGTQVAVNLYREVTAQILVGLANSPTAFEIPIKMRNSVGVLN